MPSTRHVFISPCLTPLLMVLRKEVIASFPVLKRGTHTSALHWPWDRRPVECTYLSPAGLPPLCQAGLIYWLTRLTQHFTQRWCSNFFRPDYLASIDKSCQSSDTFTMTELALCTTKAIAQDRQSHQSGGVGAPPLAPQSLPRDCSASQCSHFLLKHSSSAFGTICQKTPSSQLSTPFRAQVITLLAPFSLENEQGPSPLCLVQALRVYYLVRWHILALRAALCMFRSPL